VPAKQLHFGDERLDRDYAMATRGTNPGARLASPTTPNQKKARGTDGVMAKRLEAPYRAGERTMIKVKHERTADCVVAGFRWHKKGPGTMIGSLLLGLYDDDHTLHHVGVAAAFTATMRKQLVVELTPLRADALEDHPWRDWAAAQQEASAKGQRLPGATSRWNRGKDLSWEPLRPERVCEVAYDHMQGTRFRHAARFLRWRTDKRPQHCRYDQLEVTPAYELDRVFGARDPSPPRGVAGQGS
jgi:ATP-dependent DNA ligase